ncbi:hypothetical protein BDW67DRAFT_185403 [Aspergillus spinulosporus]
MPRNSPSSSSGMASSIPSQASADKSLCNTLNNVLRNWFLHSNSTEDYFCRVLSSVDLCDDVKTKLSILYDAAVTLRLVAFIKQPDLLLSRVAACRCLVAPGALQTSPFDIDSEDIA